MSSCLEVSRASLSLSQLRILALASLGGALEFYDFVIFAFLAKLIAAHFFPASQAEWLRQAEAFGLFGAGYLARPLGGIVMAHFGDTSGRKKIFTLSVLLMAVPTLMMGLLPSYQTLGVSAPLILLLLRIMQGAAIGGEAPGGWVFVSEHAPRGRIGLATGLLTGGLTGGIFLGSVVILTMHSIMKPDDVAAWGWRIPFILGGIFGFAAMFLRRWLDETPIFREMQEKAKTASTLPAKILIRDHRRSILCSMMMTWTLTAAIVVLILMMPPMMQTLHNISSSETMLASLAATLCLTLSVVAASALTDTVSLKTLSAICGVGLAIGAMGLYSVSPLFPHTLVFWAAFSGLCCGFVGLVPIGMLRAFPAMVRFSGVSLSYNISYAVFGGLTPAIISTLTPQTPVAPAIYVAFTAIIGCIALYFSPTEDSASRKNKVR
ncbi:MFS transporter [Gluconobacter wancherniae]|uniref:MFS transporter n=1 Tax=Gluconobacter wancherniae NBRC 103581 TaxID=656744 RepID=A0A511B672_9PROT|nr:MFS transporter [Gluconobacter wancherniae]MBF0853464.1 MFS transporter [Gluconobacter wancherniae]GBD55797.1 MFS transporter [Gluconobacter wancherniae NBRC 103581]GBR66121.1 major facilitator superfamily transporter [Gluconobacter wancherniae NBRC 103581]GEK93297.1 MFS transporter [Gluconobacter wancherniae NBRC 103581]